MMVHDHHPSKFNATLSYTKNLSQKNKGWGYSLRVENLPSVHKALGSICSIAGKEKHGKDRMVFFLISEDEILLKFKKT
jgi:hypothetical protein